MRKPQKIIFQQLRVKSAFDAGISLFLLLFFLPVWLAIAIGIGITSKGPIFSIQESLGYHKKTIKVYKFRTMYQGSENMIKGQKVTPDDDKITRMGHFLRRTKIDEVPQLINVIKGEMSLVGPRPERMASLQDYNEEISKRLDMLPGMTGLAQVSGNIYLDLSGRYKLDIYYVEHFNLLLDMKILLRTVGVVLFGEEKYKDRPLVRLSYKGKRVDEVIERKMGNQKADIASEKKKSILVICQYYYPEPFRICDICEELVKWGHEVMVVTGEPNYPDGERYQGYKHGQHTDEVINGVRVHRCFTAPRKTGNLMRLINYYSYAISSTAYVKSGKCLTEGGKPFDVIFCNQLSPVMMAEAAITYKRKYAVPLVLYCLDLWPESLLIGDIKRNSLIYKYYNRVSKRIYRSSDQLLVTSRMFVDYMESHFKISKKTMAYLPQYAEEGFFPSTLKEENGYIDLMFAGNIGKAQGLDTIIGAAEILKDEKVRFHIVGSGIYLDDLKRIVTEKQLKNVIFYGRFPIEDMPKMYEKADAMLIGQIADPILSTTLPAKVQSYMASGKPIVGTINGEAKRVIEDADCGYCSPAENKEAFAENIRKFISDNRMIEQGKNARLYYEENFEKKKIIQQLQKYLNLDVMK